MTDILYEGNVEDAVKLLQKQIKKHKSADACICFDVDETLLFWQSDDSVTSGEEEKFTKHPTVAHLYTTAKNAGYSIFIITARPKTKNGLIYMAKQLKKLNYDLGSIPQAGMYMMPKKYYDNYLTGEFKSDARDHIKSKFGVTINIMVGDQWTDVFRNGEKNSAISKFNLSDKKCYIIKNSDFNLILGLKLPSVN
tara:strand:+ start:38655 stop:39239 length:585 start_codon:yes stop_codon:yes gene_type:complete